MTDRKLIVSFGPNGSDLGVISAASEATWGELATLLTSTPPETDDKASRGWYCLAEFSPRRRHSNNLVARHALTFDFDTITPEEAKKIQAAFKPYAYAIYTTWSYTPEKPRLRVVMPTTRPMSADEFCAVSRKVASYADIEYAARESHTVAQFMFQPARKPGGEFKSKVNDGKWVDVDEVLSTYENWTDRTTWPKRAKHDEQYNSDELPPPPTEKPGIVGLFCRTFDIPTAIEKFDLPYVKTSNPNRYTYLHGSRAEGLTIYDDGLKAHSRHDTDPARGQHNAYDLVRICKFGELDAGHTGDFASLPSAKAMASFARTLPEIATAQAVSEFDVLPPLETRAPEVKEEKRRRFQVIPAEEFAVGGSLSWIIKRVLPRAEIGVVYGESGAGKSFLVYDIAAAVSRGIDWQGNKTAKGRVIHVVAEGTAGMRTRIQAYSKKHDADLTTLPGVVADAPNLLEVDHALDLTREIVAHGKADLIVIDTLAATTPGSNENSGEDMGKVLSHCKSIHKATGACVLLIHHSGKDKARGARGWSGIKAAADVEIEITRNGDFRTVTVSKMKDGSEGQQWNFKLTPVILGIDEDGDEISSCIVEYIDPPVEEKKAPLGAKERLLLDVVREMELDGECLVADVLSRVVEKLPFDAAKRDTRRQVAKRALDKLIEQKHLFLRGEEFLSTSSAAPASQEDFDEKEQA